jgi:hypothetical protein
MNNDDKTVVVDLTQSVTLSDPLAPFGDIDDVDDIDDDDVFVTLLNENEEISYPKIK